MNEMINIKFSHSNTSVKAPWGIKLFDLVKQEQRYYKYDIVGAIVNNELKELWYEIKEDSEVKFIDTSSSYGNRFYSRSLIFLLAIAVKEIFDKSRVTMEHSLSKGIYCEVHHGRELTMEDVKKLDEKMREMVAADVPFKRRLVPIEEAIKIFEDNGMVDKVAMLKHRNKSTINVYNCNGHENYFYGYMVPSTGYIKDFELKFYQPGLILRFPEKSNPHVLPEFIEQRKLFDIFREFEKWGRIMEISNVAEMDNIIEDGKLNELVLISEALHEKKISQIADRIANSSDAKKLVLISGPSSAGKTTFANRLFVQLRVNGLKPVAISIDDFFKNREESPIGEDGEFDFETIDAIDIKLFNDTMIGLINGEEVEMPTYNFPKGEKEWTGKRLKVCDDQILIVEGIHGLNELLTMYIPKSQKFKIYINALTHLSLDDHNRIPTSDLRLIRRMVRDHQFRSTDALSTIKRWDSVRRGEDKYIYPYQEEADVIFNSSLVYELSILKEIAQPELEKVPNNVPEYIEAKRLMKFLNYFIASKAEQIPLNSILREFVGSSCFYK